MTSNCPSYHAAAVHIKHSSPFAAPSSSSTLRRPRTVGMATPYTGKPCTCLKLGAPSSRGLSFVFWQLRCKNLQAGDALVACCFVTEQQLDQQMPFRYDANAPSAACGLTLGSDPPLGASA